MDVFSAFPNAIISDVWQIGTVKRSTTSGDIYVGQNMLDVVVDEGVGGDFNRTPDVDAIDYDTLIYARPEQLPSPIPEVLTGDYLLKNVETGQFYDIQKANVGKNQENGVIEHFELWIKATEATEDDD